MRDFEQWCRIISVVTIISSLLLSLMPKNKLKSSIKTLTAILIIFSVTSSFGSIDLNDFDIEYHIDEKYKDEISELPNVQLVTLSEEMIESIIDTYIKELDLKAKSKVIIKTDNNVAVIKKIEICGNVDDEHKDILKRKISDEFKADLIIDFSG